MGRLVEPPPAPHRLGSPESSRVRSPLPSRSTAAGAGNSHTNRTSLDPMRFTPNSVSMFDTTIDPSNSVPNNNSHAAVTIRIPLAAFRVPPHPAVECDQRPARRCGSCSAAATSSAWSPPLKPTGSARLTALGQAARVLASLGAAQVPGQRPRPPQYKIHLLAPALGDYIEAVGAVLKSGRTLTVCQLEVFAVQSQERTRVAAGQQTLICLPARSEQ